MRKSIILVITFTFLSVNNTTGKVSARGIQEHTRKFKKDLTAAVDTFVTSANEEALEKLKGILPEGPEGKDPYVEKDVFAEDVQKSAATVEIFEKKIDDLKKKKRELKKILKSQKSIEKEWNRFWKRPKFKRSRS